MDLPDTSIVIPYAYRGDWEATVCRWVRGRWAAMFPTVELVVAGSDPFERAASRNAGAAQAAGSVLIFSDADTFPLDPASVAAAVDAAHRGAWTLPATYYHANPDWSYDLVRTKPPPGAVAPPSSTHTEGVRDTSPGGLAVMPRAAFDKVHGYDEGFTGWGYEDAAMRDTLDHLHGHHRRGVNVVHIWHPRPTDSTSAHPAFRRNRRRWGQYRQARNFGGTAMARVRSRMERER